MTWRDRLDAERWEHHAAAEPDPEPLLPDAAEIAERTAELRAVERIHARRQLTEGPTHD